MGRSFTASWLEGDPDALRLLPCAFRDPASRRAAVDAAAARPMRPEVHDALAAQEGRRPRTDARRRALDALAEPGTVAVVTGQQVGLWLGPMYTLHKAVSAVATARALAAETGRAVVPVFWLQTEDADFDEVRRVGLPGDDGDVRAIEIGDALGEGGARTSLHHRRLGAPLSDAHTALEAALAGQRHDDALLALLARHYRPDATFGEAFAGVLIELLGDHGLVVIDPRAPELAPLSAPVHRAAITRAAALSEALEARAAAIDRAGFDVQVPVRQGAPLSCFHPDGAEGPRFRLVPVEGGYELAGDGRIVTEGAVLDALADDARRLSTTALLRPILQDSWLPTAAYVGGPGELAYFAELPPLYEAFERPMPLAVPRARFRVLGATARRLGEKLGLASDAAARSRRSLLAELGQGGSKAQEVERTAEAAARDLEAACDALRGAAEPLDAAGFERAARGVAERARHGLEKLVDRYARAEARADEITCDRLDRWRGIVAPGGAPQERALGMPFFAAQHGPEGLVAALLDAARPYEHDLVEVRP